MNQFFAVLRTIFVISIISFAAFSSVEEAIADQSRSIRHLDVCAVTEHEVDSLKLAAYPNHYQELKLQRTADGRLCGSLDAEYKNRKMTSVMVVNFTNEVVTELQLEVTGDAGQHLVTHLSPREPGRFLFDIVLDNKIAHAPDRPTLLLQDYGHELSPSPAPVSSSARGRSFVYSV